MRIDLQNPYNEGIDYLNNWRSRYSKIEYPSKIVLNIFYRQYTMSSIWDSQIDASFSKYLKSEPNISEAFRKLEIAYSNASQQFVIGNTLIDLMNKKEDVGGINYANNIPLIEKAKAGDNATVEELEFTYLYYLLCNKATLMWAAFGRNGFNKIDAIAQVTGVVIEFDQPITYSTLKDILSQLGITTSLNRLYRPLPNLF